MTTKQIATLLRSNVETPVFVALMEVLEDSIKMAVEVAVAPGHTPDDRTFNCGRAAALKDLSTDIKNLQLTKDEDLE